MEWGMDKVLFYHSDAMDQNDMDLIERALLRNERLAVDLFREVSKTGISLRLKFN
jgi:hypothetical protein